MKIACILDDFSFESYKFEADFLQLDPKTWKSQLSDFKPDFIFVESAWRGGNGKWFRKISEISNEIIEVASWAEQNKVPMVFWHKEVPPHIATFMLVSTLFDYIFLTDADCIEEYKKRVGHSNVFFLPFACQPKIHNPVQSEPRANAMIYAGTYYPEYKYPDRHENFRDIFGVLAPKIQIDIFDRSAGKGNYTFPKEFLPYIKGSLPFPEVSRAYRRYRYGLNMNSVKNSSTMCSRRVFELIASNTLVIGNFSQAVRKRFGELTICSDDPKYVQNRFDLLQSDETKRDSVQLNALRKVMEECTYTKNILDVLSVLSGKKQSNPRFVILLSFCNDLSEIESTLQNFNRQDHPNKKLYIVTTTPIEKTFTNVTFVTSMEGVTSSFVGEHHYFGILHPAWTYGKFYITDLIHGFMYGDFQAITKASHFEAHHQTLETKNPELQYQRINQCAIEQSLVQSSWFDEWKSNGKLPHANILSIDKYNLCKGIIKTDAHFASIQAELA